MFGFFRKVKSSEESKEILIKVLNDTKKLLLLPENDYAWSSWENPEAAIKEIDDFIRLIENDQKPNLLVLKTLFAPTGPIQEVSLSSGWGDPFLILAARFDEAVGTYK